MDKVATLTHNERNQLFRETAVRRGMNEAVVEKDFWVCYLRPEVRLEIGPLASFIPRDSHMIQPYAAQEFPDLFDAADCPVVAIAAERTFWEKATILHQQAHRTSPIPSRFARHYYDTYRLANSPVKDSALSDLDLLADVVAFKSRFYRSTWARYEDARPGTFRLIPDGARLAELVRDYGQMEIMIFGNRPTFDEIIICLRGLEDQINSIHMSNADEAKK